MSRFRARTFSLSTAIFLASSLTFAAGHPPNNAHGSHASAGPAQPHHPPSHPNPPPSHPSPVTHPQVAPVTRHEALPLGGQERHHEDGSRSIVHSNGSQTFTHADGHVAHTDAHGQITESRFGGTKVTNNEGGSRTITSGNKVVNQHITVNNNVTVIKQSNTIRSSFLLRSIAYNSVYESRHCSFWPRPILFFETGLVLGALNYGFFGHGYAHNYNRIWGYDYWNNYAWDSEYTWYHHYSSFYWKPYGYWERQYRPSFALVDWLFASTFDYAWQERMEAAREMARQANENRALMAQSAEEADSIRANIDSETEYAVQSATSNAQAVARAQDTSQGPRIDQATQNQFANQIEQIATNRQNNVPIDAAFETALKDSNHLFLVQANSDKTYDDGNSGQCKLSAGDILQKDPSFGSDLNMLGLRVKVGHPEDCRAGSTIIMTAEDLAAIYNSLHEQMDVGAKQLADANQPNNPGSPPRDEL